MQHTLKAVCAAAANKLCADCHETGTQWAAVNLGVLLCIKCAGIHRSLGTHISKVKSISMDSWALEEVKVMAALGNEVAAGLFEVEMPRSTRLRPISNDAERRDRIEKKYVALAYAAGDVKKRLKKVYKAAGYGGYGVKEEGEGSAAAGSGDGSSAYVDAATQREAAMASLYGPQSNILLDKAPKQRRDFGDEETEQADVGMHRISKDDVKKKEDKRKKKRSTLIEDDGEEEKNGEGKHKSKKKNGWEKADHNTPMPIRGPFGIVNVPEEEQAWKLQHLLRCFGLVDEGNQTITGDTTTSAPAALASIGDDEQSDEGGEKSKD